MGYGYALLPTSKQPTSTLTFRLTPAEKRERDEWIIGAVEHGLSISDICVDVGLSEQRVKQIIKQKTPSSDGSHIPTRRRKFKTPREAALYEFENEEMHPSCRKSMGTFEGPGMCNNCWSRWHMTDAEYDANGWPYSWAMYGQEKYIEAAGG